MRKYRVVRGLERLSSDKSSLEDFEEKVDALVEAGYSIKGDLKVSDQYGYVALMQLDEKKYEIDALKEVPHSQSEEYLSNGWVLLSSSHIFSKYSVLARRKN